MATLRKRFEQLLSVSLYRNAVYLIAANLTVPLTGLIFWVIAARFYSPEDVGVASAMVAAMTLLALFSTLGLNFGIIRFLPHSGQSANRMLNSCLTIGSLAPLIFCGIFIAGVGIWSPALLFLRQDPLYLMAFIVFTVATTLSAIVNNAFVAQRRSGFTLVRGLIFGLLRLPLPILLVAILPSLAIFSAWGISLMIAIVVSLVFFLPRTQPGYRPSPVISRGIVSEMMRFSLANYLANLFWLLPGFILPLMVLNMLGAEANAYFYIAWAIGNVLSMVPMAISTSLFAEGSYDEQRLGADTRSSLKLTSVVLVPAAILILILADKLVAIFGSSYSEEGTTLLRILVISTLPMAINYIYLSTKRVEKKLLAIVTLSVLIALATLVISYLLLPRMGINGAGIAQLGSQGVVAAGIVVYFLSKRTPVRERLDKLSGSLRRNRG